MNAQDIHNLQEAYMEVVQNQQLDEAKEDEDLTPLQKIRKRNKAYSIPGEPAGQQTSNRRAEHSSRRGVKKKRGATSAFGTMRHVGGPYTEEADLYDIILSHLLDEGYAETPEAAEAIMVNMGEEWRESIVEGGFNSSGRYDVGGGRTVGPVAGAVRSLFSGNLPKGRTYVPPSPQKGTNRPPAVPASRDDSGRLTTYGAGGGAAAEARGQTRREVMRQGAKNLENKKRLQPVNQGPDFGR